MNGTNTASLTLTASNSVPGGSFPITVPGTAYTGSHAAQFTLSTQVTTVTSVPTAVLNGGQSVQVPVTLSPNSPTIASCGVLLSNGTLDTNGSITGVTCEASGSGSLNVTVQATTHAQHGTYVLALNGGAVQFHVAIADDTPGSPSGEYTVTAGQTATFTIDSPVPDDLYTEGTAVPYLNGAYVGWVHVDVVPSSLTVTVSPPSTFQPGDYTLDVNLCGCFFTTSERANGQGDICEVVAPIEVEQAAAPNPRILFGTGASPADITNTTVTVAIGQQINLTGSPGGGTLQTPPWQFRGGPIAGWPLVYTSPTNPTTSSNTPSGADNTQATAQFYWTTKGSYIVTFAVLDGAGDEYQATATFSVVAPTYTIAPISTGTVGLLPPNSNGHVFLQYGANNTVGVTFPSSVQPPQGFTGATQWVQVVISSAATYEDPTPPPAKEVCATSGLDTKYPASTVTSFTDSPNVDLDGVSWATVDTVADNYDAYLMWQPATPNAIWVPIAHAQWSWSAGAAANANGIWSLAGQPDTPAPIVAATSTYPIWGANAALLYSCQIVQ